MNFARAGKSTIAAAGLFFFAACGGSGSSGFDGAITSYCGSGAPVVIDGDSAAVDFDESSDPLPCPQLPGDPGCTTAVGFEPSGFPETAVFRGAWAESERGPWTLSSVDTTVPGSGGEGDQDDDVVVVLPDAGEGEPSPLVIAVLVYLEPLPDDSPAVSLRLRGFEPDIVYVSSEVEVAPSISDGR